MKSVKRIFIVVMILGLGLMRAGEVRAQATLDAYSLNWTAGNYLENLLDKNLNLLSFSHENAYSQDLYFIDVARALVGMADEDSYTPLVRLETINRLAHGLLKLKIPHTKGSQYFLKIDNTLYREDGIVAPDQKILDSYSYKNRNLWKGAFQQQNRQDGPENVAVVAPEILKGGVWVKAETMVYGDTVTGTNPRIIDRIYTLGGVTYRIAAKTWKGGSDRAPEYHFVGSGAEGYRMTIDQFNDNATKQWFTNPNNGAVVVKYDGILSGVTDRQEVRLTNPSKNHLVLYGHNAIVPEQNTLSNALLIGWQGKPSEVVVTSVNGKYDKVTLTYVMGSVDERIWILPFNGIDRGDDGFIETIGNSVTTRTGTVGLGGVDPVKTANWQGEAPAGLAAAAFVLKNYQMADAPLFLDEAKKSLNYFIEAESRGVFTPNLFYLIAAGAYLIKTDSNLRSVYKPSIRMWANRIVSQQNPNGSWEWLDYQLKNMLGLVRAYELTGDTAYLTAYEKARATLIITPTGISWNSRTGTVAVDPNNWTWSALFLGTYGYQEPAKVSEIMAFYQTTLGNFGVGKPPVGWGSSDNNPYFLGLITGRATRWWHPAQKRVLCFGEYPTYDHQGKVTVTNKPVVAYPRNPTSCGDIDVHSKGGDVNRDGKTDARDFGVWMKGFGLGKADMENLKSLISHF